MIQVLYEITRLSVCLLGTLDSELYAKIEREEE